MPNVNGKSQRIVGHNGFQTKNRSFMSELLKLSMGAGVEGAAWPCLQNSKHKNTTPLDIASMK